MDLNLKNRKWKAFKINDIFIISTGANVPNNILTKGSIPRITAKDNNNGVFDFYKKPNHRNYRVETNFISISFLGSVFYHPYLASLDMKIHSVKISNIELNKYLAEFLVLCLKKMTTKFSYGNQLSSKDLPKNKILLPISSKGEPDYKFMEQYMWHKQKEKEYQLFIQQRIKQLKDTQKVASLDEKEWKEFSIKNLFSIERGKRLIVKNRIGGNFPFVTAGFKNQGVAERIGNKEQKTFLNSITIDMFGNVFYRNYFFKCDDNIHVLSNTNINSSNGNFIVNCIQQTTKDIFNYGKQFRMKTLEKQKIMLPINQNNQPDYEFMENYIKNLEYKKLSAYLEFKKISLNPQ